MSEITPNTTKICPTCGTRLNINAARCSVCGAVLTAEKPEEISAKSVQGMRLPEVTISLPLLIGLAALLLILGAGGVYAVFQMSVPKNGGSTNVGGVSVAAAATHTPTATVTSTATVTQSPTPDYTATPISTATPLPPILYKVKAGDLCGSIAYVYGVSVNALIQLNQLNADCAISPGMELKVPQPTATPQPLATNTLNPTQQAQSDCKKIEYVVKSGDTLMGIAANYAVNKDVVLQYSGKTDEIVRVGEKLVIPLCEQSLEAPTATPVPPYPAANLLQPADGAYFRASDAITLQWSAVGDLGKNEQYAVTIIDVTDGNSRKAVNYVTDTKLIVPDNLRPASADPHVFYWTVLPVRQIGTNKDDGTPIWQPAGDVSAQRSFSWSGGVAPANTPVK